MLQSFNDLITPIALVWNYKLLTIAGNQLSLGNLLMALIMLVFASRLSRMATQTIDRRVIQKLVPHKSAQVTYQTFVFYGCLAGFVTLSLALAGIPLTVFTVFGGALAIGVGFGSQNIVNNFISGIILLVEKPIKIGDIVELDNIRGTVISIGTRSTQIRTLEGKVFVVPNSFFLEKSVLNWSYEDTQIRTQVDFGVAYGSDVRLVEKVIQEIIQREPGVLPLPEPFILFENFNDSTLDFQVHFWCDHTWDKTLAQIRSSVRFKIDQSFKEHHIQMAFPQRDMNFKMNRPIEVKVISENLKS
jgi:small-conductance mechanosensitive channel